MARVQQTWNGTRIRQSIVRAQKAAAERTGKEAVQEARRLVPIDTGALHDSIGHEVRQAGDQVDVILFADEDYASHVELGTSRMAAQPYIRPAADAEFPRYGEHLKAEIGGRL